MLRPASWITTAAVLVGSLLPSPGRSAEKPLTPQEAQFFETRQGWQGKRRQPCRQRTEHGDAAGVEIEQRHGKARVHVRFLGGDPAEVLKARKPTVLDDEVQLGERARRLIDIGNVEGVPVERVNRRALVHVNVLDAQLLALLQIPEGPRVI